MFSDLRMETNAARMPTRPVGGASMESDRDIRAPPLSPLPHWAPIGEAAADDADDPFAPVTTARSLTKCSRVTSESFKNGSRISRVIRD